MTVSQMVQFLRLNLDIPSPEEIEEGALIDPLLLQMTDEELLLYLNIAVSQSQFADIALGEVPVISDIPQKHIYRLILVAKRSLYFALATRTAPKVDLGADNNNYLKLDQRFQHYMSLIGSIDDELKRLDALEDDGGGGTGGFVMTYDTTVVERYFSPYNQQKRPLPSVKVSIVNVLPDAIEITWRTSYISKFYNYRVWVSENSIIDMFDRIDQRVAKDATLIFTSTNPHERTYRVKDLDTENSSYYIAVSVTTMEGLTGYAQVLYEPPIVEEIPEEVSAP